MKVTTTLIALAAAAMAAPTPDGWSDGWDGDNGSGGNWDNCDVEHPHMVCCDSSGSLLGGLLCNLAVLGDTCSASAFCCENPPPGGLINLNLLNCVKF